MTALATRLGPGNILPTTHHYYMEFLKKDKVRDIIRICDPGDARLQPGKTVYDSGSEIIDYKIASYFEQDVPHCHEIIDKVLAKNKELFKLDIDCMMRFQYIIYDVDNHFEWHPDGPFTYNVGLNTEVPENTTYRKLTLVLMLTPHEEYEGGEFMLVDPQLHPSNSGLSFKMDAGEAILFPSFLMHKVNPVTAGQRRTLVAWFCGPRWR
jgi:PKHD-type hydroxylase